MKVGVQCQRLYRVRIQRLLLILGIIGSGVVLFQLLVFPYKNYISTVSHATEGSAFVSVKSENLSSGTKLTRSDISQRVVNISVDSDFEGMERDFYFVADVHEEMGKILELNEDGELHNEITFESNLDLDNSLGMKNVVRTDNNSSNQGVAGEFQLGLMGHVKESDKYTTLDKSQQTNTISIDGKVHNRSGFESPRLVSPRISRNEIANLDADSRTPSSSIGEHISSANNDTHRVKTHTDNELLETFSASWSNNSLVVGNSIMNKRRIKPTSISQMTSLLLQSLEASKTMGQQWSSPRDRELGFARLQIESAPVIRNSPSAYASLFRNFSMFKRSYELMERTLKVYVYKEGDKPVFHQPHLRGIYASEGWFMKLIEGNKQFVARDPRKAHLFYLPFSSLKLRNVLHQQPFAHLDLEKYLRNYRDNIAKKYRFWNRTRGADHFLVACHDWAPRITSKSMGSCIRAICNTNVARGFRIGKDVSLPVTYIRTSLDPQKDLGGNPPSERPILAFFAGGMHGYLRPILVQSWENKEPDMKIFGPMPRNIEGKTKYREYMKSSKYCICARGYEVHTPRVVEALYYECVPVIISDNYVPPFFEVLDWEAFSVFVLEKDIPNLRSILLSIPEEKYILMQQRVKMVQQHFLWHKKPVKYDLFHTILHSVWYNRVFQL